MQYQVPYLLLLLALSQWYLSPIYYEVLYLLLTMSHALHQFEFFVPFVEVVVVFQLCVVVDFFDSQSRRASTLVALSVLPPILPVFLQYICSFDSYSSYRTAGAYLHGVRAVVVLLLSCLHKLDVFLPPLLPHPLRNGCAEKYFLPAQSRKRLGTLALLQSVES